MRILITAPYSEKARRPLIENFGEVVYKPWKKNGRAYNEDELSELLAKTKADALITEHDEVSEKVIESCPNLQFIGVCRGTPSNVALRLAAEYKIPVFHTPARNAQAVAEMFIGNVITLLRNTMAGWQWLQKEHWGQGAHTSYLQFKGNELAGKTIGMVGFGAVGQRIAQLAKSFPCKIQYYDPFLETEFKDFIQCSLSEIFESSDIISINLPVNDDTRGMIDKKLLSKMSPGTVFVNMARAVVVNRDDLYEVLSKKHIRGAVLDVFYNEPPDKMDYQLIHLDNVLATPHIAGATFEVEDHHAEIMNESLLKAFALEKKEVEK